MLLFIYLLLYLLFSDIKIIFSNYIIHFPLKLTCCYTVMLPGNHKQLDHTMYIYMYIHAVVLETLIIQPMIICRKYQWQCECMHYFCINQCLQFQDNNVNIHLNPRHNKTRYSNISRKVKQTRFIAFEKILCHPQIASFACRCGLWMMQVMIWSRSPHLLG